MSSFYLNCEIYVTDDDHTSKSTETITSQLLTCSRSQLIGAITRLHVTIKDYINLENLIPFLDTFAVFTKDEKKFFMNKYHSDAEKVGDLIMRLDAKDEKEIRNFVKALNEAQEHSGHIVILKHLHETVQLCS